MDLSDQAATNFQQATKAQFDTSMSYSKAQFDLINQSLATLKTEREDIRRQRDNQYSDLATRVTSLEHGEAAFQATIGKVEARQEAMRDVLQDIRQRQDRAGGK